MLCCEVGSRSLNDLLHEAYLSTSYDSSPCHTISCCTCKPSGFHCLYPFPINALKKNNMSFAPCEYCLHALLACPCRNCATSCIDVLMQRDSSFNLKLGACQFLANLVTDKFLLRVSMGRPITLPVNCHKASEGKPRETHVAIHIIKTIQQ